MQGSSMLQKAIGRQDLGHVPVKIEAPSPRSHAMPVKCIVP